MKGDHDSDSEDIAMTVSPEGLAVTQSSHPKQDSASSTRPSAATLAGDHFASDIQAIEGEVSHMVVETTLHVSREHTPPVSSSSSVTFSSSPCSSASSREEPLTPTTSSFSTGLGGGVNKSGDTPAQNLCSSSSSVSSSSSSSRSNSNQNSSYTYNRSGPWSFSSSSSGSSTSSSQVAPAMSMSSLIQADESIYAAVPVSHELYIIPKSSRGFHWNGDLFLKPHQRRSLGVDHMFSMANQHQHQHQYYDGGNGSGSSSHMNGQQQNQHHHNQDSSVLVHEIRLDDQETAGILPSWP